MKTRLRWTCIGAAVLAGPVPAADLGGAVDKVMAPYARADRPGCAVGLFDGKRTVLARGYGAADLAWRAAITPDTRFELGSAAKQFTALAILMLERDGRLSTGDPVRKHLPQLPARYDGITLGQMLRHTSGIPDYMHLARIVQAPGVAELTRASALALADSVPPVFAPGADFAYSNTAYLLLADVVEAASGMRYAAFLDARIFRPLGMTDTHAVDPSRPTPGRATLYDVDGNAFRDGEWRGRDAPGAWGVRSTIRDLGRYNAALTARGGPLAPYLSRMTAPGRLASGEPVNYGAGLYVGSYRGLRTVRHPGRINVDLLRFPDSGRAVAVMCNRMDVDVDTLAENLADAWLGAALGPRGAAVSAAAHATLAGDYVAADGEMMRIVADHGALAVDGWGALYEVAPGTYTAGPSTDGMRMTPSGPAGHERLTVSFQSGLPAVFDRYTPTAPSAPALRALAGTYRNDGLRSVYVVTLEGNAAMLSGPDRVPVKLEPIADGLFAAGGWHVRVRRAPDGGVAAIEIGTRRTPALVYERAAPGSQLRTPARFAMPTSRPSGVTGCPGGADMTAACRPQ